MRARQMRRVLARWERSGLTLREFGLQRRIPPSTLSWWQRVFRDAGDKDENGAPAENAVVFTEVPKSTNVPRTPVLSQNLNSDILVMQPTQN